MSKMKKKVNELFIKAPSISATKGLSFEAFVKKLKNYLNGKDEVIESFLFGSYARGDQTEDSDLDLVIICQTDVDFFERHKLFPELFEMVGAIDLLIYTPEEFNNLVEKKGDYGFWKSILNDKYKLK